MKKLFYSVVLFVFITFGMTTVSCTGTHKTTPVDSDSIVTVDSLDSIDSDSVLTTGKSTVVPAINIMHKTCIPEKTTGSKPAGHEDVHTTHVHVK